MQFDINRLNNGRIQIAAHRNRTSNGHVLTYPSSKEAAAALVSLGFDSKIIDQAFATIAEFNYGPHERVHLPEIEMTIETARAHGFLV